MGTDELPLKIFSEPLISQVQADLLFVRATGTAGGDGQQSRGLMTLDAFVLVLSDVAVHCLPESAGAPDEALEVLYRKLLMPFAEQLLGSEGENVLAAVALLAEPHISLLLHRAHRGLTSIF